MPIKGIIFDMDGTITLATVDLVAVNKEVGIPDNEPILEYIAGAEEPKRSKSLTILEKYEARAAETSKLNDGVVEVLKHLGERGIKTALLTRNSRRSVEILLKRHKLHFDAVVTREDAPPKPSPYPVKFIGERLGIMPKDLLMVGDVHFDVFSGKAAGAKAALLCGRRRLGVVEQSADYRIKKLSELINIIDTDKGQ
ncbi:MAG TPA: HAD family hydrolase [Candidatus Avalokitesvara rifleensis]|uniref:HAD family hydrolase n=1 Tax=Candidatus Avalokitesvara rifleensis TaxID=3367620 RepID=UPI0027127E36|nr:HAD family hydrolase [Candidatus Brocadiales bacterium]